MLGRCDPRDDHAEVADKIDDYLWLKLSQVTCEEDDQSDDKLTLTQLQCRLLEYGWKYFLVFKINTNFLVSFHIITVTCKQVTILRVNYAQ